MSANASDVITYIGVPLAVLGILPILYTCINALINLTNIKRELHRNGIHATTRGSLMSGIVEVELPRYNISPLRRDDPKYWSLSKPQSSLLGGSWTVFKWDMLVTGHQIYRLQYKDELRQPQAEIEFEELIAFLLDRGAVPSIEGWRMLRTSGLWTPTGTRLLLSPDTIDPALRVAAPDDSDGNLSLMVSWEQHWDRKDSSSLPPYWMRIERSALERTDKVDTSEPLQNSSFGTTEKEISLDLPKADSSPSILSDESDSGPRKTVQQRLRNSMRLHVSSQGVQDVIKEDHDFLPGAAMNTDHLIITTDTSDSLRTWYASIATALQGTRNKGLWAYLIPENVLTFAQRDSMPCGVLELLGVMTEHETPDWATPYDSRAEETARLNELMKRTRKMQTEQRMEPAQAAAARLARQEEERWAFVDRVREEQQKRREREEKRLMEALNSPRLDNRKVAQACLRWLVQNGYTTDGCTPTTVVEELLYCMIEDPVQAMEISQILDKWQSWSETGGMNRAHWEYIKDRTPQLCRAACAVSLLKGATNAAEGGVMADMRDAIRAWKKVRLG